MLFTESQFPSKTIAGHHYRSIILAIDSGFTILYLDSFLDFLNAMRFVEIECQTVGYVVGTFKSLQRES